MRSSCGRILVNLKDTVYQVHKEDDMSQEPKEMFLHAQDAPLPGDDGGGPLPPPTQTCPPCQPIANDIDDLNGELHDLGVKLHSGQGDKGELLKQIKEVERQKAATFRELRQCEEQNGCPPPKGPPSGRIVTVTFTGVVTLVTDHAHAMDPFTKKIPTDLADCEPGTINDPNTKTDLTFTFLGVRNASQMVGFVDFPTFCQFVVLSEKAPRITTILTVTLNNPMDVVGQTGPFTLSGDGSSAEMQLPKVTLHLHSSFHLVKDGDQDSDGIVTFTTGTAAQEGPFQPTGMHWDKSSGHIQLVGTTTLMGGALDKAHAQFTLDGTL